MIKSPHALLLYFILIAWCITSTTIVNAVIQIGDFDLTRTVPDQPTQIDITQETGPSTDPNNPFELFSLESIRYETIKQPNMVYMTYKLEFASVEYYTYPLTITFSLPSTSVKPSNPKKPQDIPAVLVSLQPNQDVEWTEDYYDPITRVTHSNIQVHFSKIVNATIPSHHLLPLYNKDGGSITPTLRLNKGVHEVKRNVMMFDSSPLNSTHHYLTISFPLSRFNFEVIPMAPLDYKIELGIEIPPTNSDETNTTQGNDDKNAAQNNNEKDIFQGNDEKNTTQGTKAITTNTLPNLTTLNSNITKEFTGTIDSLINNMPDEVYKIKNVDKKFIDYKIKSDDENKQKYSRLTLDVGYIDWFPLKYHIYSSGAYCFAYKIVYVCANSHGNNDVKTIKTGATMQNQFINNNNSYYNPKNPFQELDDDFDNEICWRDIEPLYHISLTFPPELNDQYTLTIDLDGTSDTDQFEIMCDSKAPQALEPVFMDWRYDYNGKLFNFDTRWIPFKYQANASTGVLLADLFTFDLYKKNINSHINIHDVDLIDELLSEKTMIEYNNSTSSIAEHNINTLQQELVSPVLSNEQQECLAKAYHLSWEYWRKSGAEKNFPSYRTVKFFANAGTSNDPDHRVVAIHSQSMAIRSWREWRQLGPNIGMIVGITLSALALFGIILWLSIAACYRCWPWGCTKRREAKKAKEPQSEAKEPQSEAQVAQSLDKMNDERFKPNSAYDYHPSRGYNGIEMAKRSDLTNDDQSTTSAHIMLKYNVTSSTSQHHTNTPYYESPSPAINNTPYYPGSPTDTRNTPYTEPKPEQSQNLPYNESLGN